MNAIRRFDPCAAEAAIQSGPVLVIAGAGTGKTKTLTAAVRAPDRGLRDACQPRSGRHLTNKAAAEMTGAQSVWLSATERRRIGRARSTASAPASCASSRRWQTCDRASTFSMPTTHAA